MKSLKLFILLVVSVVWALAWAPLLFAYDRAVHVQWTKYTGPVGATVTAFKLYQEGAPVCNFPGADIVSGDCTVNITKLDTPFTLSAAFAGGQESPLSTPFVFRDLGQPPQGLNITVVTVRTVSSLTRYGNIIAKTTVTTKEVPADTIVNTKPINYWNSATKQYISQTTLVM